MASDLQRVARGLVECLDQMPQIVAHLQRTAARLRQQAGQISSLSPSHPAGKRAGLELEAAARACEEAAELAAQAPSAARAWAQATVGMGGGAKVDRPGTAAAPGLEARSLGDTDSDVANVIERLMADREHPLDLTRALSDPKRRKHTLRVVTELAEGRLLSGRDLDEFRATRPGRGLLFNAVPADVNEASTGESRKALFIAHGKELDPARRVGTNPTDAELAAVNDYARRLNDELLPQVRAEVADLARAVGGATSIRVKSGSEVLDKVERISGGSGGRSARPDYQVGDVVDAVGARITADDTEQLEKVVAHVRSHFGTGSRGRVLEMENMYASPKAHNRAYRVVPFMISTEAGGQRYAYELQVCTRRASIASDIEHNTLYKPYIDPTPAEQATVRRMQAEAAALDQEETRRRH